MQHNILKQREGLNDTPLISKILDEIDTLMMQPTLDVEARFPDKDIENKRELVASKKRLNLSLLPTFDNIQLDLE